ncbi:MAG: hypothetical protein Kow00128_21350 [Deltaproteobacteria bacterium]
MPAAGPRRYRSSRAFLVRSADLGETDRRLSFFTEDDGEVAVLGKAAHRSRKRFGGALQRHLLLDIAWTEVSGRIPVLDGAVVLESFWSILDDWDRVRHADYLLELASALFPHPGPKPKVFSLLLAGMRALAGAEAPRSRGRKAEAAFLSIAGFGPDLSACRRCGKAEGVSFRFLPSEGRIVCARCMPGGGTPLSPGAVKTWRALQSHSPPVHERIRIPEAVLDELQEVIPKYLEWCIGRPMRSLGDLSGTGKP